MSILNGVGKGNATGAEARILKKLQEHQSKADALRIALAILREDTVEKKSKRQTSIINGALAIEETRLAQKTQRKREEHYNTASALRKRRGHSVDVLKAFDNTPKTVAEAGLPVSDGQIVGSLTRYGYLKPKGKLGRNARFIRTAKSFSETPTWKMAGK